MTGAVNVTVTVHDPVTGESDKAELRAGSYVLVCGSGMTLAHEQVHANGTVQLTIRKTP